MQTSDTILWEVMRQLSIESPRCSVREMCVLHYVISHPGCSIKEIGEDMWDDPESSSASLIPDRWVKRGWMEVRHGSFVGTAHRSKTSVVLTPMAVRILRGESPVMFKPVYRKTKAAESLKNQTRGGYWE